MNNHLDMLRHTVATLAYRGGKALRGAPPEFAAFRAGITTRSPGEILAHLGDLLDWALSIADGRERRSKHSTGVWRQTLRSGVPPSVCFRAPLPTR